MTEKQVNVEADDGDNKISFTQYLSEPVSEKDRKLNNNSRMSTGTYVLENDVNDEDAVKNKINDKDDEHEPNTYTILDDKVISNQNSYKERSSSKYRDQESSIKSEKIKKSAIKRENSNREEGSAKTDSQKTLEIFNETVVIEKEINSPKLVDNSLVDLDKFDSKEINEYEESLNSAGEDQLSLLDDPNGSLEYLSDTENKQNEEIGNESKTHYKAEDSERKISSRIHHQRHSSEKLNISHHENVDSGHSTRKVDENFVSNSNSRKSGFRESSQRKNSLRDQSTKSENMVDQRPKSFLTREKSSKKSEIDEITREKSSKKSEIASKNVQSVVNTVQSAKSDKFQQELHLHNASTEELIELNNRENTRDEFVIASNGEQDEMVKHFIN